MQETSPKSQAVVPTPALGDRSLFPELAARAYLNHAAVAPPSRVVIEAVERALTQYARLGQGAFSDWAEQRERLREQLGVLLGTRADNIALVAGTSHALTHLALAIPWQAGDRVVLFTGEFPANITPWQRAAKLFGLELCFHDLQGVEQSLDRLLAPLEERLKNGVRLVAISAVQFQTGLRMPLAEMAALCQRYGAEIAVDAIQATGVVPVDVEALGLDYVAGGAHKWLMGIEGAGYLYIRPDRMPALDPPTAGWLSHENAIGFLLGGSERLDYGRPLQRTAQVFEASSSSVASFAALRASLELILSLGVAEIHRHVTGYLDALGVGLAARGYQHLRSPRASERSGILSMRPPHGISARMLADRLRQRGVYVGTPEGLLRFSPHFPNSHSEVAEVLGHLDECLGTRA